MLLGKLISHYGYGYTVKAGSVTIDITADVRALLDQERADHERALAELRASYADILDRYDRITSIVLAGGTVMPTG